MNLFEEVYARRDRAKALLSTVTFVPVEHGQEFKGTPLKAYEVRLDGKTIGRVTQEVHHTYKVHGRVRYHDRHTVRWQYDWPHLESDVRSLYYDTRQMAVTELLAVAIKKGRIS